MSAVYTERRVVTEKAGSIAEAAGGIAVVVLSIIALGGVSAGLLTEIAVIVLGAALLTEGGAVTGEYSVLASRSGLAMAPAANGIMSEFLIGAAVLVLGILAIIGVSPATLVPAAVIAAGVSMLVTAPLMAQVVEARSIAAAAVPETAQPLLRASVSSMSGLRVMGGLAALVLGILALVEGAGVAAGTAISPTLPLVALLVLGAALTFNGTALTASLFRLFER